MVDPGVRGAGARDNERVASDGVQRSAHGIRDTVLHTTVHSSRDEVSAPRGEYFDRSSRRFKAPPPPSAAVLPPGDSGVQDWIRLVDVVTERVYYRSASRGRTSWQVRRRRRHI